MRRLMLAVMVGLVAAASARADDAKATWREVAVVADGVDLEVGRDILLEVDGDSYVVSVGGKAFQKGKTKVDTSKPVRESDVMVAEGYNAGKTIKQISKVEGDVLIACAGAPGGDRPAEFKSKPGSGHTLSVWIRVK